MSLQTAALPVIENPAMLDRALDEIATKLASELTWLDRTFGDTQRFEEIYEGRKRTYPVIRTEEEEYIKLIPDGHIGSFSFCHAIKGDEVEWNRKKTPWVTTNFSVIFWFDLRDIFPTNHNNKTINNVKDLIVTAFKNMSLSSSIIEIEHIYDEMLQVYEGYTFVYTDPNWIGKDRIAVETGNLFFMRPYGCLRFEGTTRYLQNEEAYTC